MVGSAQGNPQIRLYNFWNIARVSFLLSVCIFVLFFLFVFSVSDWPRVGKDFLLNSRHLRTLPEAEQTQIIAQDTESIFRVSCASGIDELARLRYGKSNGQIECLPGHQLLMWWICCPPVHTKTWQVIGSIALASFFPVRYLIVWTRTTLQGRQLQSLECLPPGHPNTKTPKL